MIPIKGYRIVETDKDYPGLLDVAKEIDLRKPEWIELEEDYFISSHILVVIIGPTILGYLRFSIQQIGIEENRPPIIFNEQILTEAKVQTFGVVSKYRNQGVGRTLQEETMKLAKIKGCYQLRSKSSYEVPINHHLKISMGFGIQPSFVENAVYFAKTL